MAQAEETPSPKELNVKYPPFIMFEHVNLNSGEVEDKSEIHRFWFDVLKAGDDTRADDVQNAMNTARRSLGNPLISGLVWVNIGLQQFHLPYGDAFEKTFENPAMTQQLRGVINLIWPKSEMDILKKRLVSANFEVTTHDDSSLLFKGPSNNCFCVSPSSTNSWLGPWPLIKKGIDSQGLPGNESEGLGISGVTFNVPHGTAVRIGLFYKTLFGCTIIQTDNTCRVLIGSGEQYMSFHEVREGFEIEPYDGHHVCLYINYNAFKKGYFALQERSLVFCNPRFPQFSYNSWEEADYFSEYRVKDITDLDSGEVLYQLEHEVRNANHPGFLPHRHWLEDDFQPKS